MPGIEKMNRRIRVIKLLVDLVISAETFQTRPNRRRKPIVLCAEEGHPVASDFRPFIIVG